MNIEELILKIKDDELKEVIITKENGKYRGQIQLTDSTKKLSEEELENVLRKLITEINLFSQDFTKSINKAFFEKIL
jgi:hypothetical protein